MKALTIKQHRQRFRQILNQDAQLLKPSMQQMQSRRDKKLDKEVLECYRLFRGYALKHKKGSTKLLQVAPNCEYQNLPQRQSMKQMGNRVKFFGENLKPLKAYLFANIGKSWDKVYGNLCQKLDRRSVSGNHIFEHISDFVKKNYFDNYSDEDIEVFLNSYKISVSAKREHPMFVHPKTGILCHFFPRKHKIAPSFNRKRH